MTQPVLTRRGFLGGLAGVLASGMAPAIVRNPMKIWVPKQEIITDPYIAYSKWYNVQAARQDEFGEVFFPTLIVSPERVAMFSKNLDQAISMVYPKINRLV